jgi:2'-hydroxyisoflavone reductase
MGDLVDALAAASASAPEPAWVEEATLIAHRVEPWVGLPLWIPASEPDGAGFLAFDCTKAQRAGLRTGALAQTIADTAAWLVARDNAGAWKNVIDVATERAILDEIDAGKPR